MDCYHDGGNVRRPLEFVKANCDSLAQVFLRRPIQPTLEPIPLQPIEPLSPLVAEFVGEVVVLDLSSPYVCLGTLHRVDAEFFELHNADLHDFRDSSATRDVYVYDSRRLGIRRNRERVLIRREEVVAMTRFLDIVES